MQLGLAGAWNSNMGLSDDLIALETLNTMTLFH